MRARAFLLVIGIALVGCKPSMKDDLVTICEVEKLTRVDGEAGVVRDRILEMFILRNTHSEEADKLMTDVWAAPPKERPALLRAAASKEGLHRCALADSMEKRAAQARPSAAP